jgi:hypothetical protein
MQQRGPEGGRHATRPRDDEGGDARGTELGHLHQLLRTCGQVGARDVEEFSTGVEQALLEVNAVAHGTERPREALYEAYQRIEAVGAPEGGPQVGRTPQPRRRLEGFLRLPARIDSSAPRISASWPFSSPVFATCNRTPKGASCGPRRIRSTAPC